MGWPEHSRARGAGKLLGWRLIDHPGHQGMLKARGAKSIAILAGIWAVVLLIHLVLRLPDVWLWISFPALFVPWLLFGPKNWFDP